MELKPGFSGTKVILKGLQGIWQGLWTSLLLVLASTAVAFFENKEALTAVLSQSGWSPFEIMIGLMVCAGIAKMLDNLRKQTVWKKQ